MVHWDDGVSAHDFVAHSDLVIEFINDLVRFEQHQDIAVEFVRELAFHKGNATKAAWFLEYARVHTDSTDYNFSPLITRRNANYEPIKMLIKKQDLLTDAVASVKPIVSLAPSYWQDTLDVLSIQS